MSWEKFRKMNLTMQQNVCMEMYKENENFMFDVSSTKGYYGMKEAYHSDETVKNAVESAMEKLGY